MNELEKKQLLAAVNASISQTKNLIRQCKAAGLTVEMDGNCPLFERCIKMRGLKEENPDEE